MRSSRILMIGGLALATVLAMTACSGGGSSGTGSSAPATALSGPEQEWYDAAKGEEPIRFYTSQHPSSMDAVIAAFEQKYPGVQVEGLRLTSGALGTRYAQEKDAGTRTADVIAVGDTRFVLDGLAKGYFETFDKDEMPATAQLEDQYFNDGVSTAVVTPYGICYNTQTVTDAPTEWEDILNPDYDGRIIFPEFRNSSLYVYTGQLWIDAYGEDFLERLAALHPVKADSMVPGLQSVANGQADVAAPCGVDSANELISAGAPIEVAFPDNAIAIPNEMAITAGTPSPNASRLFYSFMLSDEGQQAFGGESASSVIGTPGLIPLGPDFVFPDVDRYQETFDIMAEHF
ncbi:extracellular solute-binding protein [Cnuibacter physcomitrellae]|uniref:extracellular solute-binding protein n=1 Tax=Cnuibacter physcomitrellae TaxID=1619308 RepID=UPI002175F856|nr:extracellular solute-binding protein [Cnuibacter physcomitrellae]MCS5498257.1 extracellular solute-binding protein [Cnuibacter physcomitrellae]